MIHEGVSLFLSPRAGAGIFQAGWRTGWRTGWRYFQEYSHVETQLADFFAENEFCMNHLVQYARTERNGREEDRAIWWIRPKPSYPKSGSLHLRGKMLETTHMSTTEGMKIFMSFRSALDHLPVFACHPCAGSTLTFSVLFQFYWVSPRANVANLPKQI